MASNTPQDFNSLLIYEVAPYNFSAQRGFAGVQAELSRIKELGVDVVWLIPIHPRGVARQTSTYGSAYAVRDYRAVDPGHGTREDFKSLIDAVHAQGMKLMMDVVYNHTSADSVLLKQHPEYFLHDEKGELVSKEWLDVVDLDYSKKELWDYQIQTLVDWATLGVDGYRCDVAPLVPMDFWSAAREAVEKVHPGHIWLCESCHARFIRKMRSLGYYAASDAECYQAFDLTYDYDAHPYFEAYMKGEGTLAAYVDALNAQLAQYPANFVKLRFLENHDQVRIRSLLPDDWQLYQWTAFAYFLKGATLLYAGQEFKNAAYTRVTEPDLISRDGDERLTQLLKTLGRIKKLPILSKGWFTLDPPQRDSVAVGRYSWGKEQLVGVFNFHLLSGSAQVGLPDGAYKNLLDGQTVHVQNGQVALGVSPLILQVQG